MIEIRKARTAADIAAVTDLVWQFFDFLRQRYPEKLDLIDRYIAKQDVAAQLADFSAWFNPPAGECLLGRIAGTPAGIVMLKPERPGCAEMNRMYVTPEARGHGLGRALAERLLDEARALGYAEMRLGALERHVEALPLYRSLGFRPDPDPPEGYAAEGILLFHRRL